MKRMRQNCNTLLASDALEHWISYHCSTTPVDKSGSSFQDILVVLHNGSVVHTHFVLRTMFLGAEALRIKRVGVVDNAET
jgi:hypothetical protein